MTRKDHPMTTEPSTQANEPAGRTAQDGASGSDVPSPVFAPPVPAVQEPDALYDKIEQVLLHYRGGAWEDENGDPLPLVDLLSPSPVRTIEAGRHEIRLICDAIYNEVLLPAAAPPQEPPPQQPADAVPWPTVSRYSGGASAEGVAGRVWIRLGDGPEETEYVPVGIQPERAQYNSLHDSLEFANAERARLKLQSHAWQKVALESGGWLPDADGMPRRTASNQPGGFSTQVVPAPDPLHEALVKITRLPVMPFPDPGAHSWQAFAEAVYAAWNRIQIVARAAVAKAQEPGGVVERRPFDSLLRDVKPAAQVVPASALPANIRQLVWAVPLPVQYEPIGGCTCRGPDGPCEACIANEEAHDEWLTEPSISPLEAADYGRECAIVAWRAASI